ncbi:hypothetical protein MRX96_051591 [Rhipicephalus microplus]
MFFVSASHPKGVSVQIDVTVNNNKLKMMAEQTDTILSGVRFLRGCRSGAADICTIGAIPWEPRSERRSSVCSTRCAVETRGGQRMRRESIGRQTQPPRSRVALQASIKSASKAASLKGIAFPAGGRQTLFLQRSCS